jgi:hypothetical protein
MPYSRITALVPAGEHFDESAVNEGVHLTVGHVSAIENALDASATAAAGHKTAMDALNKKLEDQALQAQQAVAAQKEAEKNLADANKKIETHEARIVELEEQVDLEENGGAELPGTKKKADKTAGKAKVPFHLDANNPINALADSLLGAPGKKKNEDEEE